MDALCSKKIKSLESHSKSVLLLIETYHKPKLSMAKTIPETIQFVTNKKKNGEREGKKNRRMISVGEKENLFCLLLADCKIRL